MEHTTALPDDVYIIMVWLYTPHAYDIHIHIHHMHMHVMHIMYTYAWRG